MMTTNGFVVRAVIRMLGALPLRIDDAELIGSSITLSTTEQVRSHYPFIISRDLVFRIRNASTSTRGCVKLDQNLSI